MWIAAGDEHSGVVSTRVCRGVGEYLLFVQKKVTSKREKITMSLVSWLELRDGKHAGHQRLCRDRVEQVP